MGELFRFVAATIALSVLALVTACQWQAVHPEDHEIDRSLASAGANQVGRTEPLSLKYITYRGPNSDVPCAETISLDRWQGKKGGFSAGGRYDYLTKFWSATTRQTSNRGLRHDACFTGSGQDVANYFFSESSASNLIAGIRRDDSAGYEGFALATSSADGMMVGVQFFDINRKTPMHFRMANCLSGKTSVAPPTSYANCSSDLGAAPRGAMKVEKFVLERRPAQSRSPQGFAVLDKVSGAPPKGIQIPKFELRADYERADAASASDTKPWERMDLTTERGGLQFSLAIQKYFYEGMANQNLSQPSMNFIAQNNKQRYWCHMPWMEVGDSGREAVHGLTKERDLRPSEQMPIFADKNAKGTNWGIAFLNATGCRTLGDVFGSVRAPKENPDFSLARFPEGSVSVKVLFTSALFPAIEKAFTWFANVSDIGSKFRSLKPVRHIQMDIAVKDSTLQGSRPEINHWVMGVFYFDPNYDYIAEPRKLGLENPLRDMQLPEGLKFMRPMGVQTGLGPVVKSGSDTSIIFPGAHSNGLEGRLNGPADNPKSSCLACHGAAGTGRAMVPGIKHLSDFNVNGIHLDFNQQMALAKQNFETQRTSIGSKTNPKGR